MDDLEGTGIRGGDLFSIPRDAHDDLVAIHERDTWVNSLTEFEYAIAREHVRQFRARYGNVDAT